MTETKPMKLKELIRKLNEFNEDLYIHGVYGIEIYQFKEEPGVVITYFDKGDND